VSLAIALNIFSERDIIFETFYLPNVVKTMKLHFSKISLSSYTSLIALAIGILSNWGCKKVRQLSRIEFTGP
jgi:hypothetical protein